MKKKLVCLFMIILLIFNLYCIPYVSAEVITNGSCGENLTWSFENEILKISGTGDMTNYSEDINAPWYHLSEYIVDIEFGNNVTSIGAYAFYGCTSIRGFILPNNITKIGYVGTEEEWGKINIDERNDVFQVADIIYNYVDINLRTLAVYKDYDNEYRVWLRDVYDNVTLYFAEYDENNTLLNIQSKAIGYGAFGRIERIESKEICLFSNGVAYATTDEGIDHSALADDTVSFDVPLNPELPVYVNALGTNSKFAMISTSGRIKSYKMTGSISRTDDAFYVFSYNDDAVFQYVIDSMGNNY